MSRAKEILTKDITESFNEKERFLLAAIAVLTAGFVALMLPVSAATVSVIVVIRVAIVGLGAVVGLRIVNSNGRSFRLSK